MKGCEKSQSGWIISFTVYLLSTHFKCVRLVHIDVIDAYKCLCPLLCQTAVWIYNELDSTLPAKLKGSITSGGIYRCKLCNSRYLKTKKPKLATHMIVPSPEKEDEEDVHVGQVEETEDIEMGGEIEDSQSIATTGYFSFSFSFKNT